MICPVTAHVMAAALRAMTTIHVAQRSAMSTIFALPASADCTSRIMRRMELSSPTFAALMSKAVTSPITASRMMGMPQRTMATHAMSNGSGFHFSMLQMTAIPEITRKVTSFLMPPSSSSCSSFSMRCFI